ncbi:cytochrome P450 [Massariosphaeria phaeospora]|uniref:Cytochrome P450 n=1 Tax=Massariosphaeria phaeospora TaxID=100035 RepID=A0A7C8M041_9PLEO|nr:cytochrome P450 [Massariosphaeria phaeospora]
MLYWTPRWYPRTKERMQGFVYLLRGPSLLLSGYAQARGEAFHIQTPSNNHLMVTSELHTRELARAPPDQLSLHAVAKEVRSLLLQPKHTMFGFEWRDQRGVEGTGFVRALRSLLTAHLPVLIPELRREIAQSVDSEVLRAENEGVSKVRISPMIKRVVTRVNCLMFFGPELAQNSEFTEAALEFIESVVFAAELLRMTPWCLQSFVATMATRRHRASKALARHLAPVVQARLDTRDQQEEAKRPVDCMQWVIDTSPRKLPWSAERMMGEILALWFASVHQLAMVSPTHLDSAALLDWFVQESMRVSNSDAISTRRKAIERFEFSDGLQVQAGDWVCIPQQAILHDDQMYANPARFDPMRFRMRVKTSETGVNANTNSNPDGPRFTDVSTKWPVWGLGNAACPGRFYASITMKLILAYIVENYDCTLCDTRASRSFSWRSSIVPKSSTVVNFRRRDGT